jgi:hypothetical protein
MQERLRLVNEHYARITGHDFCHDTCESFHTIARLINELRGRVEPHRIGMNTPLLYVVARSSIRETNSKLPQMGWVQDKMPSKSVENHTTNLVPLGIVSEKHLEASIRGALQVTSALRAY